MADDNNISSYLFFVEIDGIETARFQKCEGLEAETSVFEYEEGGGEVHHFKGRTRFPNIILEKGITDNDSLFNWFKDTCLENKKLERKNGSVVLKDLQDNEVKRWNFFRAFPCRWIGPKLDYKDPSTFVVERIEIAHEGIEVDNDSEPQEYNNWFHIGRDMSEETNFIGAEEASIGDSVYYDNYGNPSSDPNVVTGQNMGEELVIIPAATKITDAAENHLGEDYHDGNSCDEWAAKVIEEAGYNPQDYELGNTSQSVMQHINALQDTGLDYSQTSDNSAYVVFMGDGTKSYTIGHEHAGLLVTDSSGKVSFYHSSANNEGAVSIVETYDSVFDFQNDFAYSSFYYQEIY